MLFALCKISTVLRVELKQTTKEKELKVDNK